VVQESKESFPKII